MKSEVKFSLKAGKKTDTKAWLLLASRYVSSPGQPTQDKKPTYCGHALNI